MARWPLCRQQQREAFLRGFWCTIGTADRGMSDQVPTSTDIFQANTLRVPVHGLRVLTGEWVDSLGAGQPMSETSRLDVHFRAVLKSYWETRKSTFGERGGIESAKIA